MNRELTEAEKDYWYGRALWPCCKKGGYIEGPRVGAMSVNVMCPRCGTRMNVIDPWRAWGTIGPGQMLREPSGYKPPKVTALRRLFIWLRGPAPKLQS